MPDEDFYRQLDGDGSTAVARERTKRGVLVPLLLIGGVFGAWGVNEWRKANMAPPLMTSPDKEEFQTSTAQLQTPTAPVAKVEPGIIAVPPEPLPPPAPPAPPPTALPPPPSPEAAEPPAPLVEKDDSEARRRAEEERRRREEERRWARLRAPMLLRNESGSPAGDAASSSTDDSDALDDDPNRRFLAAKGSAAFEVSEATQNKRIDALVPQGTIIQAVLDNAVQSDLPGMVRATVKEDVFSFDGRRVLIPAGSRLIGDYKSGLATGQTRVFIVWTRLLRADGVSVQLGSIGGDALGRAGVAGFVDEHYVERFGSAILLSIAGAGAQYLSTLGQKGGGYYGGYGGYPGYGGYGGYGAPNTVTTTDPVTGVTTTTTLPPTRQQQNNQAMQIASQTVGQSMNNIAQMALRNSINIPPTIYLDQGAAVTVFVRKDLSFARFYPDPVQEALREIRNERRSASSRVYK